KRRCAENVRRERAVAGLDARIRPLRAVLLDAAEFEIAELLRSTAVRVAELRRAWARCAGTLRLVGTRRGDARLVQRKELKADADTVRLCIAQERVPRVDDRGVLRLVRRDEPRHR